MSIFNDFMIQFIQLKYLNYILLNDSFTRFFLHGNKVVPNLSLKHFYLLRVNRITDFKITTILGGVTPHLLSKDGSF